LIFFVANLPLLALQHFKPRCRWSRACREVSLAEVERGQCNQWPFIVFDWRIEPTRIFTPDQ